MTWYDALSLREASQLSMRNGTKNRANVDPEYRKTWFGKARQDSESLFDRRMNAEGINTQILAGKRDTTSGQDDLESAPGWSKLIDELYTESNGRLGDGASSGMPSGFISLCTPIVIDAETHVVDALRSSLSECDFARLVVNDKLVSKLRTGLENQLREMVVPVLVLEMNVARLEDRLEGDSPADRFQNFVAFLSDPAHQRKLLGEYPVLARRLVERAKQWERRTHELLLRLSTDLVELEQSIFSGQKLGACVDVSAYMGDPHCDGQSVTIFEFALGQKVVYKPHSLTADIHFQELLVWLSAKGARYPLRQRKIVDRDEYGWAEFVFASSCERTEDVERFYWRTGALLALLYILDATDFHLENVVAAGDQPVLIDLEAVFHARRDELLPDSDEVPASDLNDSVWRSGLLPNLTWSVDNEEPEMPDMSGLGGKGGQLTPFPVPRFEGVGTDQMRLVRKRIPMPGRENRPGVGGEAANPEQFAAHVVRGFTETMTIIKDNRQELLSLDGPIRRFSHDTVRFVMRATRLYGSLITHSNHPDFQRCGFDRDRLLDKLWNAAEALKLPDEVILAEVNALRREDVPMFRSRPNSRSLWTDTGEEIQHFFSESAIDRVANRIQSFSQSDVDRQVWYINSSLSISSLGKWRGQWPRYARTKFATEIPSRQAILGVVEKIASRLDAMAFADGNSHSWMSVQFVGEKTWTLQPVGNDLYSGLPGIALFFAHASRILANPRCASIANRLIDKIRRRMDASSRAQSPAIQTLGAFGGKVGIVYLLAHAGITLNRPELVAEAVSMATTLQGKIAGETHLDVIDGSAGIIGVLASLHRLTGATGALIGLREAADYLCEQAKVSTSESQCNWATGNHAGAPLTGFAHGAAGISWALLSAYRITRNETYRKVAAAGIEYEQGTFSTEHNNWPDFREGPKWLKTEGVTQGPTYQLDWCHGAPGISLSRVSTLDVLSNGRILRDVELGVRTTVEKSFGRNHSLCHGDLGNLDVLLALRDQELAQVSNGEIVEDLTAMILSSVEKYGVLCGTPQWLETPGLMQGLSGIGYGLLRIVDPTLVPSVLTLDLPR